MNLRSTLCASAFLVAINPVAIASAQSSPTSSEPDARAHYLKEDFAQLSVFTSAGYLATSGANGAALSTGLRLGLGRRFALGFDFGYGLMKTDPGMQDRWWLLPSMAVVFPTTLFARKATFDVGVGFGLGTSSGYSSWSRYASKPFTADWEFQLEPAARAHAIASIAMTPTVDVFVRAEAAALALPHGSNATVTDSTWTLFSLGTRFALQ